MPNNNGTVNDSRTILVNQGSAKTKNNDHVSVMPVTKKGLFSNECPTLNKNDKEAENKNTTNDKTNNGHNMLNSATESEEFIYNYMFHQHNNDSSNGKINPPHGYC